MPEEKRPTFLLDDSPAEADAFGTHERLAKAILELVENAPGGRAIALVGSWGSGKSTVVSQLRSMAAAKPDAADRTRVLPFVFDAWAHEGDPLRRSFLELLITALRKEGWIDPSAWDTRVKELSRRQKRTETTVSPLLELPGAVLLLFIYLAPLALVLASGYHWFWHKWRILWIAIFLYLIPVFIALWHWLRHRQSPYHSRKFDLLGLMASRTVQKTETQSNETPDPTSVEFQQVFRDIAGEALNSVAHPHRKLLLVIDNLDRVEVQDALRLWSSMTAFLDYTSASSSGWPKQVWTLVPFDESGIRRLWDRKDGQTLGETFLAKTFQVRFRVPEPVLSDWSSFLRAQLKKAFPQEDDSESYKVAQVFSILRTSDQPPTPREMKMFINQMVGSYRSYRDVAPLSLHAVMASLSSTTWRPGAPLPHETELVNYIGTDWSESLAALHYNLPRDNVMQVLYGGVVERSFMDGDAATLGRLIPKPGMPEVAFGVLELRIPSWLKDEPFRIGRAALACESAKDQSDYFWEEIWRRLAAAARQAETWEALDPASGRGLATLVARQNKADFTKRLIASLSRARVAEQLGEDDHKRALRRAWVEGVLQVARKAVDLGQGSCLEDSTLLSGGLEYLLRLDAVRHVAAEAKWSADEKRQVFRYLRPSGGPAAVMSTLESTTSSAEFESREGPIETMLAVEASWNWEPLVQAIQGRLQQVNAPVQNVGSFVRTLLRLSLSKASANAEQALSATVQNGWLFHYLFVCQSASLHQSVAICILAIMLHQPEASGPSNPGNAVNGRSAYRACVANAHQPADLFPSLVAQASEFRLIERLLDIEQNFTIPRAAIREIANQLARGPDASTVFPPNLIVGRYPQLASVLEKDSFEKLVMSSATSGGLVAYLTERVFAPELATTYRRILGLGDNALQAHIVEGLRGLPKETWLKALREGLDLVFLAEDLQRTGTELDLDFPFQDALSEFADQALSGTAPTILTPETCRVLVSALNLDQRENFKRHLADKVTDPAQSIAVFLPFFGEALGCAELAEEADKLVREGLPKMLARAQPTELRWIAKVLRDCPEILAKAKSTSVRTFETRLARKIEEENLAEEIRSALAEILTASSAAKNPP
jgi:KAP family P-loop domain